MYTDNRPNQINDIDHASASATDVKIDVDASATGPKKAHRPPFILGVLPFIGLILFVINAAPIVTGSHTGNWQRDVLEVGVTYLIGVAGIGAAIAHIFFGKGISRSIGWAPSPYELEVGFANLGFGVVGIMASSYQPQFWLAAILCSSIFRVGCGFGHIRQMVQHRNFAINNTSILFLNFAVPAFLILGYIAWA